VVTADYLTAQDSYPRPGAIACEVLSRTERTVRIDTTRPWCVVSSEGETRFEVAHEIMIEWE